MSANECHICKCEKPYIAGLVCVDCDGIIASLRRDLSSAEQEMNRRGDAAEREIDVLKSRLYDEAKANAALLKELNAMYAELGIFRHTDSPERGADAIQKLSNKLHQCELAHESDVRQREELRARLAEYAAEVERLKELLALADQMAKVAGALIGSMKSTTQRELDPNAAFVILPTDAGHIFLDLAEKTGAALSAYLAAKGGRTR
jgi:septal ring factor EnvC (AmiA/AmiB activator)